MVPSLANLSMRSVLINKLPHNELPESIQDRLQRIKEGKMYNTEDLETFHYHLDVTPQNKLASDHNWCSVSAVRGCINAFKLCLQYNCKVNLNVVLKILLFDRIEMFELLSEEQRGLFRPELAFEAAACNYKTAKCLQYLYRNHPKNKHPSTVKYTKTAASYGNLMALEMLHNNGCPMNVQTTNEAIKSGSVACLKYAIDNGVQYNADRLTMLNASCNQRYDMFKFLHSQGHAMDSEMWYGPIEDKADDMVKYMINHGCLFDERATAHAAYVGHLPTLKLLRKAGCPWDENVLVNTISGRKPHIQCFRYALKEGAPMSRRILTFASMHNSLPILKMAIEAGCPLPIEDLVYTATRCGSLSCLKYLHKTNEIKVIHLRATITFSHVNCLKYILEHTDLDIDVLMEHDISDVKCYEYLKRRAEDDPEMYQIDPVRVMNGAAVKGHMEMVRHLRLTYGVEWSPGLLMNVFENGPFDMFYYMVNNGGHIKELDIKYILEHFASNVKNNRLTDADGSEDNKRKLGLIGTLFGLAKNEFL